MPDGLDDFRLGPAVVRPSFNEIVLGGGVEHVEPRVMNVLLELAKHEGRVVTRDALIEHCWKGLSVSDDALTRCVSRLRTLFRATGDLIRIETIPKRGYCLQVRGTAPPNNEAAVTAAPARSTLVHVLAAGVSALAVTAAVALLLAIDARSPVPAPPDRSPRFTAGAVDELVPTVAPGADAVTFPWPTLQARSAHLAQPVGGPCRVVTTAAPTMSWRWIAPLADERETQDSPRT